MTLFIYGDVNHDLCLSVQEIPQPGGDIEVTGYALTPGGSAANCACIAAKLGAPTEFIGLVGDDQQSDALIGDLATHGVGMQYVRRVSGFSGMITALVNAEGERTFLSYRGVNARQPYGTLPVDLLHRGDSLHLSGYSFQAVPSLETAQTLLLMAAQVGAAVSLDPSYLFARDFDARDVLARVTYLFPNEEEARLLTGCREIEDAAAALVLRGPKTVVVKAGSRGCYLHSAHTQRWVPAIRVARIADTIGAGDAFCGGFLTAILNGADPIFAARIGTATAAHVIQRGGGHMGAPTWEQVLATVNPSAASV